MIVPSWTKSVVRRGTISEDPVRFYGCTRELIDVATWIAEDSPSSSRILNPITEPLVPYVSMDRIFKGLDPYEASVLVLAEKRIPLTAYAEVPIGPSVELMTRGTESEPELLQVISKRQARDVTLWHKEFVEFENSPISHNLSYSIDLRSLDIAAALISNPTIEEPAEPLSPFISAAFRFAMRLYMSDREFFESGFDLIGPNHRYFLNFRDLAANPGTSTPILQDNQGHPVPIDDRFLPAGEWKMSLHSPYWCLTKDPMLTLEGTANGPVHLELNRPLALEAPGIREVENLLAGAFNYIKDESDQLDQLSRDDLNDLLIDWMFKDLCGC